MKSVTPEEWLRRIGGLNQPLPFAVPDLSSTTELHRFATNFPRRYDAVLNTTSGKITSDELAREIRVLRGLDGMGVYSDAHVNGEQSFFRGRQASVFSEIRHAIERGRDAGYVKLPCAFGKTVVYIKLLQSSGLRALIALPSHDLINQTFDDLSTFAPEISVGFLTGSVKKPGATATLTTYHYLARNGFNPKEYDILILDEAHEALGKVRRRVVEEAKSKILLLGFTATDTYYENKKLSDLLGEPIHTMSIIEGTNEGLSSPFEVIFAVTEADVSNVQIIQGDYSRSQIETAIRNVSVSKSAAELFKVHFMNRQGMAQCAGVDHAIETAKDFKELGIAAESLTSKDSKDDRIAKRRDFKNGSIQVLTGRRLLVTGLNFERPSVCLNLVPTLSRLVAEQRAGRVLRLDPQDSSKYATIVEFLPKRFRDSRMPLTFVDIVQGQTHVGKFYSTESSPSQTRPSPPRIQGIKIKFNTAEVLSTLDQMKKEAGAAGMLGGKLVPREEQILLGSKLREAWDKIKELTSDSKIIQSFLKSGSKYRRVLHARDYPGLVRYLSLCAPHEREAAALLNSVKEIERGVLPIRDYLFNKFLPLARALASQLPHAQSRADRMSQASEKLLEGLNNFGGTKDGPIERYLIRFLTAQLTEEARPGRRVRGIPKVVCTNDSPLEELAKAEQRELLSERLNKLCKLGIIQETESALFFLFEAEGRSVAEIAKEQRVAIGVVEKSLERVAPLLRDEVIKFFTADEIATLELGLPNRLTPFHTRSELPGFIENLRGSDDSVKLIDVLPEEKFRIVKWAARSIDPIYGSLFRHRFLFTNQRPTLEFLRKTIADEKRAQQLVALKIEYSNRSGEIYGMMPTLRDMKGLDITPTDVREANLTFAPDFAISQVKELYSSPFVAWPTNHPMPLQHLMFPEDLNRMKSVAEKLHPECRGIVENYLFGEPVDICNGKVMTTAFNALILHYEELMHNREGYLGVRKDLPLCTLRWSGLTHIDYRSLISKRDLILPPGHSIIASVNWERNAVQSIQDLPLTLGQDVMHLLGTPKPDYKLHFGQKVVIDSIGVALKLAPTLNRFNIADEEIRLSIIDVLSRKPNNWEMLARSLPESIESPLALYLQGCDDPALKESGKLLMERRKKAISLKRLRAIEAELNCGAIIRRNRPNREL